MRFAKPTFRTRWFSAVLMVALLFAQALGLVHRTAHTHMPVDATAQSVASESVAGAHAHTDDWAEVFAHDEGGAECRLFDALGHDMVQPFPLALPAVVPTAALLAVLAGESIARWAAMFDARGPPPAR